MFHASRFEDEFMVGLGWRNGARSGGRMRKPGLMKEKEVADGYVQRGQAMLFTQVRNSRK